MQKGNTIGYLPDERPPILKLLLYAIQQVIVMFPATITVALITGFHVSTTIFASGLATIFFILITGRKIPLYYGSSFSYLSAIGGLMAAQAVQGATIDTQIGVAQFGIMASGLISIAAGLIIKYLGKETIDKILPPAVTGSIAMVIGLTLAAVAMQDASGVATPGLSNAAWVVSLVTLVSTIIYSVYLKGFFRQIPLLLGPLTGIIVAWLFSEFGGVNLFRELHQVGSNLIQLPKFTLPIPSWAAVAAIMPIAIATIPESTAHVYQLDIYVNNLAEQKGKKRYNIAEKLWLNLVGDGVGDIVAASIGGPAGTNYGENISAMAITKVYSTAVLIVASVIAMVIACFTPLINAIYSIPTAVIGGLEIYLFGAIAAQGIAILMDKRVSMFSPKNIAIIATVMTVGVGGQYAFGGSIPFFGMNVPCIAAAAVVGILLNLLLNIKKEEAVD
jgi:uracil permease